jgi:hypothetical protein
MYVFVGEELSHRGQSAPTSSSVRTLRSLLNLSRTSVRPTAVRVQTRENDFICDQMSTGRFYKIARCVELAQQRAHERG